MEIIIPKKIEILNDQPGVPNEIPEEKDDEKEPSKKEPEKVPTEEEK